MVSGFTFLILAGLKMRLVSNELYLHMIGVVTKYEDTIGHAKYDRGVQSWNYAHERLYWAYTERIECEIN